MDDENNASKKCNFTENEMNIVRTALTIIRDKTDKNDKTIIYHQGDSAELFCGPSFEKILLYLHPNNDGDENQLDGRKKQDLFDSKLDELITEFLDEPALEILDELTRRILDERESIRRSKNFDELRIKIVNESMSGIVDKLKPIPKTLNELMPKIVDKLILDIGVKLAGNIEEELNKTYISEPKELLLQILYKLKPKLLDDLKSKLFDSLEGLVINNSNTTSPSKDGSQMHKKRKMDDRPNHSKKLKKENGTSNDRKSLKKKGQKLRQILENHTEKVQEKSGNFSLEISDELRVVNKESISIHDLESAKKRIKQWDYQNNWCELIQEKVDKHKLVHLRSLFYIYKELQNFKPEHEKKDIKHWVISIMKETLVINEKREQRNRLGCERLQALMEQGITYQQLMEAGCNPTTFYANPSDYDLFVAQLPYEVQSALDKWQSLFPKNTNILARSSKSNASNITIGN